MFTLNNEIYRNLEEQVQKNKEDIAAHWEVDRVLADYGIKVIGRLDTAEEIPSRSAGTGDFGDAYLIGVEPPYDVYIWTRPNLDLGKFNPYWLNLGPIAIQGPQGEPGPVGPAGPQGASTDWYVKPYIPNESDVEPGTIWLVTEGQEKGNVYKFDASRGWILQMNINGPQGPKGLKGDKGDQGPQGIQGPKGDQGEPGEVIRVLGQLLSTSQLPPADTWEHRNSGYLIPNPTTSINHLWMINEDAESSSWFDAGAFAAGNRVIYDEVSNTRGPYKLEIGAYLIMIDPNSQEVILTKGTELTKATDDIGTKTRGLSYGILTVSEPWQYNYRYGTDLNGLGPYKVGILGFKGSSVFNAEFFGASYTFNDISDLYLQVNSTSTSWAAAVHIYKIA